MEIILLLFVLCIVCDTNNMLKKENKSRKDTKIEYSTTKNTRKTQEQIDKEMELKERQEWRPNRKLFVSKEMKEQIFGKQATNYD